MADEFCLSDFHVTFRDLIHAVNVRHGTNGFTSLPKEGVLRIFSPWKIRRLRLGLNPRTWVPKASTLPLDDRSRFSNRHSHFWQYHRRCSNSWQSQPSQNRHQEAPRLNGFGRRAYNDRTIENGLYNALIKSTTVKVEQILYGPGQEGGWDYQNL